MEDKKALLVFIGIGICVLIVIAVGFFWFLPEDNALALSSNGESVQNAGFTNHDPVEWVRQDGSYPGLEAEKDGETTEDFIVASDNLIYGLPQDSEDVSNAENLEVNNDEQAIEEGSEIDVPEEGEKENTSFIKRVFKTVSENNQSNEEKPLKPLAVETQEVLKTQVEHTQTTTLQNLEKQTKEIETNVKEPEVRQTIATQTVVVRQPIEQKTVSQQVVKTTQPAPVIKKDSGNAVYSTSPKTTVEKKPLPVINKKATVTEYWIQTGSFASLSKASDAKYKLQKKGATGTISTVEVNSKDYYRVRLGPYTDKDEAAKFLEWIKEIEDFKGSYISEVYVTK